MTATELPPDPITNQLLDWILRSSQRLQRSADGLTELEVRKSAAPSGWTIAGLIGHVQDSTWFWLHHAAAGHPMNFDDDDSWNNDPDAPFSAVLDTLRRDTERACSEVEQLSSDAAPGWWPAGAWGGYRLTCIRGVLVHLLNDNAAHTGQLDVARELIDGGVWDYSRNGTRLPGQT